MRSIVFIGLQKSGSSREAIRAAENMGYFTIVFTERQKHLQQRSEFPDVHEMVHMDLRNYKELKKKIQHLQEQGFRIEAVVSFVDPHVHTAALLCEEFCKRDLSSEAVTRMEDKILTRRALKKTPYHIPYGVYKGKEPPEAFVKRRKLHYPLVVKEPGSTGAKDVYKAKDETQLKKRVDILRAKHPKSPILFEEYIDGPQYLVEAIIYNKEVTIVAVVEQEISKKRHFIVTGYSLLAHVPENLYDPLSQAVRDIIKHLELHNGSCHLELRRQNDQWKLIEINPRIGGSDE